MLYITKLNVQEIYAERTPKNLIDEVKRCGIGIIALQETKQKGNEIVDIENYTFSKSGGQDRRLGTDFLVNKKKLGKK